MLCDSKTYIYANYKGINEIVKINTVDESTRKEFGGSVEYV